MSASDLPPLDCHAHIAPDVTAAQIRQLDGAVIFAMTRSPAEADYAANRDDPTLLWDYGAHPALAAATAAVTADRLRAAVTRHVVIGEVGLDRKTALQPQLDALELILNVCAGEPVLLSLHSTGRTTHLLDVLHRRPHPGAILHWFNGTRDDIERATAKGYYFFVNAAMDDQHLSWIPTDRLLPETDFPSSRRSTQARRPGDIAYLEQRITQLTGDDPGTLRERWYRNLASLATQAEVLSRLPIPLKILLTTF